MKAQVVTLTQLAQFLNRSCGSCKTQLNVLGQAEQLQTLSAQICIAVLGAKAPIGIASVSK